MKNVLNRVTAFVRTLVDRVHNEPVLVAALIVAVGNFIGHDLTDVAELVQSAVVLLVGSAVRSQVTPVRKISDSVV